VITEKDAVKFKHFLSRIPKSVQVLSLCVEITITSNKDQFLERIRHLL
jgi:tetraacyldisaccharide-1-P 4'-kinase